MHEYSHGRLIGKVDIGGISLDLLSNGADYLISDKFSTDRSGHYLGVNYQCVEFVRRYIYARHKINLASRWRNCDAGEWCDDYMHMGLEHVDLTLARSGDILCFTGGKFGHVGIIKDVFKNEISIAGQNLFNTSCDLDFRIKLNCLRNYERTPSYVFNTYSFQSIFRLRDL